MKFVVAVALCIMLYSLSAAAQTSYGTVVGTVTDPAKAVVPGVAIKLENTATSESHSAKTDDHGNYRFVDLLPGVYKLTFEHQGFKRMDQGSVEVKTSTTTRIDLAMELGAVEQSVEVTSQAPSIDTESSTVGAVVEGKVVTETPLNGRNVMNLIALTPGVVPQGSSSGSVLSNQHGGTFSNPAGWGNYQIGGGMAGQSAMYMDGEPLNGTQNNAPVIVPTQDIISEFRVETNTVSPEYGRFAGGVVSMTTKQGSNNLHGTAYEYLRNKALNANDFFNNRNDIPRPEWTQNQYGVLVGGRIRKDKVFFLASWEGFRLRLGDPVNTPIPTTAEMGGDFGALLNGTTANGTDACGNTLHVNPANPTAITDIFDPQSHQGCVFADNQVQNSRWDAAGAYILQHYYPQNTTGFWAGNGASGSNYDQITGRVDYNLSANQRLFGRYTNWNGDTIAEDPFKNGYGKPGEKHQTHMAEIGDNYTINDKMIADVRASYAGMHWDSLPPSNGKDMTVYGGVWPALASQMTFNQNIDPMTPDGPFWGFFMDVTQVSYDNILALTGSVTRLAGKHTLKVGGEWRYTNFSNIATNSGSGQFLFPDAPVYTHLGWSDMLLGLPLVGSTQTVRETGSQMYYGGLYAMDTFQLSHKLTLNYGIRWEQPGAFREHHDMNTVFLPGVQDTAAVVNGNTATEPGLLALVGSTAYKSRYDQDLKWNLFVPRVGFAYRMTDKLVVKGGFGMSLLPSNSQPSASPVTAANNSINPGNVFPSIYNPCNPTGTYLQNAYTSWDPANNCAATTALAQPMGRSTGYNLAAYGSSISVQIPDFKTPTATQWNLSAGQDFGKGMSLELGYVGSKGTHLPNNNQAGQNINQLPESVINDPANSACNGPAPACPLMDPMTGGLTPAAQAMLPFPQYVAVNQNRAYWGSSIYNGLQARFQKHFEQGSFTQVAYTWSKMISDVDSLLSFVEDATSATGPQNQYNHQAERSISGFDVPQRIQISYFLALPFGKGQLLANGASGFSDKLVSGWGLNGITTFQTGFPMAFQAQATTLSSDFNAGTPRPDITSGCQQTVSGSAEARLNKYFNTSCFTQPGNFSFGSASRNQSNLRAQGINNWDLSAVKKTAITEKVSLEFRAEFFNISNHVRFQAPGTTVGSGLFGVVTAAANKPRIVQFATRINF